MCEDCDAAVELGRLPKLLREKGWFSSDVHSGYESLPGNWIDGSSGTCETNHHGISTLTGTSFQITASHEDLKVRVAWPGQFATTYSCYTAEQVVWWLGKVLHMADRDICTETPIQ